MNHGTPITRRQAVRLLMAFAGAACGPGRDEGATPPFGRPRELPGGDVGDLPLEGDDVDALCDVLLPTERDASGAILSAGAHEAEVDRAFRVQDLVALLTAQNLLPPIPEVTVRRLTSGPDALRLALQAELAAFTATRRPLGSFRDLPREQQEEIVEAAFADEVARPLLQVARAACFLAYLGATTNDIGLRAVGLPPFEDFADGRAVSGYPRTKDGRLVDAAREDLGRLASEGDLDDYTWNREPAATPGDDLSRVLDGAGDLV